MTGKSAPQLAWEKLAPWEVMTSSKLIRKGARVTRRQFNKIYQDAYRRGMERAAGVAEAAREGIWTNDWTPDTSVAWHTGRNAGAARIRRFIVDGAKDE